MKRLHCVNGIPNNNSLEMHSQHEYHLTVFVLRKACRLSSTEIRESDHTEPSKSAVISHPFCSLAKKPNKERFRLPFKVGLSEDRPVG